MTPWERLTREGTCAQCGQDKWVHQTYWAATVGADHRFVKKIELSAAGDPAATEPPAPTS